MGCRQRPRPQSQADWQAGERAGEEARAAERGDEAEARQANEAAACATREAEQARAAAARDGGIAPAPGGAMDSERAPQDLGDPTGWGGGYDPYKLTFVKKISLG